MIAECVRYGGAEPRPDPADRRRKLVLLTPAGRLVAGPAR
jgi:DNA-binding MarR family transcriptional regulator